MGFLKIKCHYCNGEWFVYGRDNYKETQYRTCPHCFQKIDGQDWQNHVLPAFGAMMDANRELIKTHTGYHAPLFTVDYVEDYFFPDAKAEAETEIMNIHSEIDELRGSVETLTNAIIAAAILKEGEPV